MPRQRATRRRLRRIAAPRQELAPAELRWICDPESLGVETTADITPSEEIIGQPRALRALRAGLGMKHDGYNIFVVGPPGTGRTTTVKRLLSEFAAHPAHLEDKLFVHNFKNPDMPRLITLPAGQGGAFRNDMQQLVSILIKNIPSTLESDAYQERRKAIINNFQEEQRSIIRALEELVKANGFGIVQIQIGAAVKPDIVPLHRGQPVSFEALDDLVKKGEIPTAQLDAMKEAHAVLEQKLDDTLKLARSNERALKQTLSDLDNLIVLPIVRNHTDELKKKYQDPRVAAYLDDVQKDVMRRIREFAAEEREGESQEPRELTAEEFPQYGVNVVVEHDGTTRTPVVVETNPRFRNLFGVIERSVDASGVASSDFMDIRAGSLLRADGGYLVLNALDTLVEPGVWYELKRTLRNGLLEIHNIEGMVPFAVSALKPEAIPIDLKVIMIGDMSLYDLMYFEDDDFKKIFKIRADFDVEMPKNEVSITSYTSFIKMISDEEKLRPFDKGALAEVVEYGVRIAGRQNKLTTRFNVIADLLREGNFIAAQETASVVTRAHVKKAIEQQNDRMRMAEEKIREMILENTILIATDGIAVGQVNGLSVYEVGNYAFGRPVRITAKIGLGKSGIINIEREVALSGKTHDKGVLILGGYLRAKYAQDKALDVSASLCFEQSYSSIDGDSASSTEIYAILSSLSDLPIRQDLAVTGSMNQNGDVQPIGGVNFKIEGFFDVCRARGLTGTQGVLIPSANVKDLMLRDDVIEAVKGGTFHIYPVAVVDEGIELLTGVRAGKKLPPGRFEPGTVNGLVDGRLREYARRWKAMGE